MDYIPRNKEEEKQMLELIGVSSVNDLFIDIPDSVKISKLNINEPMGEIDVKRHIVKLASKNKLYKASFLGAGSYNHYIPSVIGHITGRSEFYTAYTPYQPEMSQGILQAIFEYQTMICDLSGMDVCNASVYDGAEALAECAIICANKTGRNKVLISNAIHPQYKETIVTYLEARDIEYEEIDYDEEGITDLRQLANKTDEKVAGVIVQNPNFFGMIEDIKKISDIAHDKKALVSVGVSDPTSLGILKSPGELGADLFAGEGHSFGTPRSYGGPYLGMLAVKKELMREVPGRIVGETIDTEGKKGYLLTLQAREQHIRREKASCNICSNQALVALAATVYLSALGKEGIKELGNLNLQKSHYLLEKLKNNNIKANANENFYNEFIIEVEDINAVNQRFEENGFEPGLDIGKYHSEMKNCMLVCVTEMNTKEDLDKFIELVK